MKRLGLWFLALALFGFLACSDGKNKKGKKTNQDNTAAKDKEDTDDPGKTLKVTMETSMGTIELELYPDKAPITVKNFLSYVDDKFYDGTLFHRVIPTFMIQGGGFEPGLKKKETRKPPIKNEAGNGLRNLRGAIAMGQIPRNPDSATCEFYINVVDNRFLDPNPNNPAGYCVFGKVTDGMDVVDKIKDVKTETVMKKVEHQGRMIQVPMEAVPVEEVTIKSVRRAPEKKEK
jgi:peptidyl-prolyl cis-trans isomerase B (cyclophilin B)